MSQVNGTAGDDTLTPTGTGNEYYAGAGMDLLRYNYSANTGGVVLDLRGASWSMCNDKQLFYHSDFESMDVTGTDAADYFYGFGGLAYGDDTVRAGLGNDYVDVSKGGGLADGGGGNDTLVADFQFIDPPGDAGIVFDAAVSLVKLGTQTILSQSNFENFTLYGTVSNDTIKAGAGTDNLYGMDGNDLLNVGTGRGGSWAGSVYGGAGNDTLVASFDNEHAGVSFDGTAWSYVNSSERRILWQQEIENFNLTGTDYRDSLTVGGGKDTLNGGDGNDWLNMGTGRGTATGGLGKDTLVANFSADISVTEQGVLFDPASPAAKIGSTGVLTFDGFETYQITGTAWDDSITAGAGNDVLSGLAGDDVLDMGTGRGSAYGGDGVDSLLLDLSAETAGVSLDGSAWSYGYSGSKRILWQQEFENFGITGTGFDDRFTTAAGVDTVVAGDGNDWINVGTGRGSAAGGLGNDTLVASFGAETGRIVFAAGTAAVKIGTTTVFTQSGFENFNISGTAANDVITTSKGDDTVSGGAGNDSISIDTGGGSAVGGAGSDTLVASFVGEAGNAYLDARAWSNGTVDGNIIFWQQEFETFKITAAGGDDSIYAADGDDVLVGGEGDDYLDMGRGGGTATGGGGIDTLAANFSLASGSISFNFGTAGVMRGATREMTQSGFENFNITGTDASDTLVTGVGDDTVFGGAGNDLIDIGTGSGAAYGGAATDTLIMNFANLVADVSFDGRAWSYVYAAGERVVWQQEFERFNITGSAGNDNLIGGVSTDTLCGGAGTGRGQIDTLRGDLGADTFVLGTAAGRLYDDAATGALGRGDYALIADFTAGSDKLQLKGTGAEYRLGDSGITGLAGIGLWHEEGATDELVAVLRSGNATALTQANTIGSASFIA